MKTATKPKPQKTRLTLWVSEDIPHKAKLIAHLGHTTVSGLITDYINNIAADVQEEAKKHIKNI